MKTLCKAIFIVGLLGLSACAYNPALSGYYGRTNGYYGRNPNYGYGNYGYQGYSGGNYGYQNYGNPGYGYQGYGNYGGYQQPQYGRGRHHDDDD